MKLCLLFLFILNLAACIGPAPIKAYNQAHVAVQQAEKSGAQKYSPGLLDQAQDFYDRAEQSYKAKEYPQAYNLFRKAIETAEKAELKTRVKKFDSGESF